MNDYLGERMKENFEHRTRYFVPRRTYSIIRLDGKAFHTYTKGLNKPFDAGLYEDMDSAIVKLMGELQGAVLAYTQSDEISVLLTDFAMPNTCAWFDGNIQKMTSVSASIITAEFNKYRMWRKDIVNETVNKPFNFDEFQLAYFDSRVFTIPDRTEVMNYFRWRQQDCIRNSVSMVAQSNFSHTKLHGKSQSEMHDMLHANDVNWATDFTDGEKNGRLIVKETYVENVVLPKTDRQKAKDESTGIVSPTAIDVTRTRWVTKGAWVFTKDEGKLLNMIPKYE
jgi:tRNA(His) 5'-end guanylyltransferase